MQSDIAFLAYYPHKQRQDNNSFEGNYNIGANVIIDILNKYGVKCDICTPDTAKNYKIVLVSLTSSYDCIALYKAVSLLPSWQNGRTFTVICGGAGMQNPTTIRNYIDYAVFGRAESIIYPLINTVLGGGIFIHDSVMKLPDIYPVKFHQSRELYNSTVNLGMGRGCREWKEQFIGCPNKCLFCHYTWAHRKVGKGTYYQGELTMNRSVEVLWKDMFQINKKEGRIRTAIDGFSQRIRYAYGKIITNSDIIDGINHIGSFAGTTVLLTYNISNMPGETEIDREDLYNTVKEANPKHRVIVVFQSTPFRPSLLTPMQWANVTLFPATSDLSASVICDSENLRVMHSFTNESPYSQLETVIVDRATVNTDKLFHIICHHSKLKSMNVKNRVKTLLNNFDMSQYLKEYDINEKLPSWFLSSYTDIDKLYSLYRISKKYMNENI